MTLVNMKNLGVIWPEALLQREKQAEKSHHINFKVFFFCSSFVRTIGAPPSNVYKVKNDNENHTEI